MPADDEENSPRMTTGLVPKLGHKIASRKQKKSERSKLESGSREGRHTENQHFLPRIPRRHEHMATCPMTTCQALYWIRCPTPVQVLSKARLRPGPEGDQALSSFRQLAFCKRGTVCASCAECLSGKSTKVGDKELEAQAGDVTICLPNMVRICPSLWDVYHEGNRRLSSRNMEQQSQLPDPRKWCCCSELTTIQPQRFL